jgi:hypothetical protein
LSSCSLSVPHLDSLCPLDFLLQLQYTIEQSLGSWGTAWDIDVDRNNAITASYYGVRVVIVATTVSTAREERAGRERERERERIYRKHIKLLIIFPYLPIEMTHLGSGI